MKPISILLAEDHTVVREGLRALLEAAGDIAVIAEASTGRQAVELALKHRPDVVVMDIAMPHLNGLEATRQIRHALPTARVLILSAHSDDAYVDQVLSLGARGYLLKQVSAHCLSAAVREVHQGNTYFSPSLNRCVHSHAQTRSRSAALAAQGKAPRNDPSALSSRESEVIQLIAEGQANKQVASELGISVKTVEKHRQRLMEKLSIHDTAGLTRYAMTHGIIKAETLSAR